MCAVLKPDFAFALARHCDMAELARFQIGQRILFARPAGAFIHVMLAESGGVAEMRRDG